MSNYKNSGNGLTMDASQFQKAVKDLPYKILRKHLRKVFKNKSEGILEDAESNLYPGSGVKTGELKKSGKATTTASVKKQYISSKVAFKQPHAHLIELGHRIVPHGKDTGKRTRAFGFLRRATDENRASTLKEMQQAIEAAYKEQGRETGGKP